MKLETAVAAVDEFLALTSGHQQTPQIFFGGREPLINWPVIRQTIEYANNQAASSGREIMYILFSNCSLLTEEIVAFLKRYDVYVATSMDGIKSINDSRRLMLSEESTFDATLRGWRLLRDAGLLSNCFNCTVAMDSLQALSGEFVSFAKEWNMTTISINPDETTMRKEDAAALTTKVLDFYLKAQAEGVFVVGQWRMVFDNLFRNVGNSINTGFCSAYTGHSITIRPGGRYSLCSPDAKELAPPQSLADFVKSDRYTGKLLDHYVGNILYCNGCNVEGFCMGGCGVASDIATFNGFDAFARCDFFRDTFDALLRETAREQYLAISPSEVFPVALRPPAACESSFAGE